jgi:hypothetical protein
VSGVIKPEDRPGWKPKRGEENTDRAQLASLGDSATIRPDSATRRNCWTCMHNTPIDSFGEHGCALDPLAERSDVADWLRLIPLTHSQMPPTDADGCPGWKATDEPATDKDSLTVRPGGWRGHLPLCRGPGGTMARRMAALSRGRR